MSSFSIGLSALTTSQRLVDLTGQNIANAGTPDYHRQVALLAARNVGLPIGTGVEVAKLLQLRSGVVETALLRNQADQQDTTLQLDTLRRIQSVLSPGDGSIHDLIEGLFNQIEELQSDPSNLAQRRVVLGAASDLTEQISSVNGELRQIGSDLEASAGQTVNDINGLTEQIAKLNDAIKQATLKGIEPNDLRDRRDNLLGQLSQLVDVRTIDQDFGQVTVIAAGVPVVLANQTIRLQLSSNSEGKLQLTTEGTTVPLTVRGGKLNAMFNVRNQIIPDYRDRISELANTLVQRLDDIQATGLGLSGSFTFLGGDRAVSDKTVPLAQAGLSLLPQAGVLAISVTDQATGQRTLTRIAIDPATQSLQDVAAAISGVNNIQAVVDPQTNTLKILANPGYSFDFAGKLPTAPDTAAITGTTTPQISGTYTGSTNDTYTYRVVGSGTIGVTPGLKLELRDGGGSLLGSFDIGQGYEPGSALPAINGVTVRLSAGIANDGDSFTVPVVSDSDTADILPALGLNAMFTGSDADSFRVRPELLDHPEALAVGQSGLPDDSTNLQRMADLRDMKLFAGSTQNLREFYAGLVGDVAVRVQDLDLRQTAQSSLGEQLQAERQSVSGVDPNEELARLLEFQRSFQMAAKYLATVNETLSDLMNII